MRTHPDQHKHRYVSPRRRLARARVDLLPIKIPGLRLPEAEDRYKDVPECWWSGDRWVAMAMALYDLLYDELRACLRSPSVKRSTFLAWAQAEAGVADFATGRDCRPSLRYLTGKVGRHKRTIQRCRELARLLDLRQEVFRGRLRTRDERLESWRRDDHARGWCSVAALIPSPSYAHLVDNSALDTYINNAFVTPPSQRLGSSATSSSSVVTSLKKRTRERAPRCTDKSGPRRKPRERDRRATVLAARVRSDERLPLWARQIPVRALERVLTSRAVNGWQVDDVYEAVDALRIAGKRLIGRPDNPIAYLVWVLGHTPVDEPPAAQARAQEAALEMQQALRDRDHRERLRSEAMTAAARAASPDSPGRVAAMAAAKQIGQRSISTAARDRAAAERARREIARCARDDRAF